jgi:hypothetical protein
MRRRKDIRAARVDFQVFRRWGNGFMRIVDGLRRGTASCLALGAYVLPRFGKAAFSYDGRVCAADHRH